MLKRVILLSVWFYSSLILAQDPDDLTGSWTEIIGQHKISSKWSIPATAILQNYELFDHFQFILLRSGITYNISENASASLGYDYFYSEAFSKESFNLQHRLWEQFTLKDKYSGFNISHRYRLEHIWTRQQPEYELSHRMRYRFKVEHFLNKRYYATAFDEIFINMGTPYFNQNRLHLGLGYVVHPSLKIELGYLKIHFNTAHYDRLRLGLVFNTQIFSGKEHLPAL